MKTLFRLVFGALLLVGWGLAGLSLHVIRTPTAIGLIPKSRLGLIDTYVDTRHWKMSDVAEHPLVIKRVLENGQAYLLHHITGESGKDLEGRLADALKHPQRYSSSAQAKKDDKESDDGLIAVAEASFAHWWDQH